MNPSKPMSTDAPTVPAAVPLRRLIALLVDVGVMIAMLLALAPASAAERTAATSGSAARALAQEIPFVEIAARMGVTKGRIAQIHHRALDALRARLTASGMTDWSF